MLRRQGVPLLLHHLARGGDRPRHFDARHGCEAFGHVVCPGPRRLGGFPDAREVAHLRGGSQGYFRLNVNVSCMLSQGRLSRHFVLG